MEKLGRLCIDGEYYWVWRWKMTNDTKDYSDYELHYHEKAQAKIEDYQQGLIDQIVKLLHGAKEKLDLVDYADFIIMIKDILEEE